MGFALFMWMDWEMPHTKTALEARDLISACEATLPRNESCELTAKPVTEIAEPKAEITGIYLDCTKPNPTEGVNLKLASQLKAPMYCKETK